MRPYLIFIFLLNIAFANFAHALDGVVSENCSPAKPVLKPLSSSVKTSGKEVTVIQTVDSCPKTQSGASSQGIELIEKSAKFAIDAAGESTKSSAAFAEKTLDTVKNFIAWIGAFLTILLAFGSFLGYKTFKDLRNDVHETMEKHVKAAVLNFDSKAQIELDKLKVEVAKVSALSEEIFTAKSEILDIKSAILAAEQDVKRETDDSSFEQGFSNARAESVIANTVALEPATKQQLMLSAIHAYTSLIYKTEKIDLKVITGIITSQGLRFESWDNDITDDRAFLLGWLYRDKAVLQKRLNDLPAALKTVEAAIKVSPKDWGLVYNLGCYQCLTGDLQAAIITAIKCLTSPYAVELASWIKSDSDYEAIIADKRIQSLLSSLA